MDFSRESGEGCAERRSSIHYAFIMQAGKGFLEHLKKRGRGGCEMFGNVEKQRRNKEKAPIFRLVLCGGDKRDRTADLLNAIQALSQLSYTPIFTFPVLCCGLSSRRSIIISNAETDVNTFFKKFQKSFPAGFGAGGEGFFTSCCARSRRSAVRRIHSGRRGESGPLPCG